MNRALEEQPDWAAARENRDIARERLERLKKEGGDMTGGIREGYAFSPMFTLQLCKTIRGEGGMRTWLSPEKES